MVKHTHTTDNHASNNSDQHVGQGAPEISRLHHIIDVFEIRNGILSSHGWLFHETHEIVNLTLILYYQQQQAPAILPVDFGKDRKDVADHFSGHPHALKSGFAAYQIIDQSAPLLRVLFRVTFKTGENFDLELSSDFIQSLNSAIQHTGNLQACVDALVIRNGILSCTGWLFHETHEIVNLTLILYYQQQQAPVILPVDFGKDRKDVADHFSGHPHALKSGFFVYQAVNHSSSLSHVILRGTIETGETFDVTLSPEQIRSLDRQESYPIVFDSPDQVKSIIEHLGLSHCDEIAFIIDHSLGGGSNQYRKNCIAEKVANGKLVLMLGFNVLTRCYFLEAHSAIKKRTCGISNIELLIGLAKKIKITEIIFNNAASFDCPLQIPQLIVKLQAEVKARVVMLLHDFFTICPSTFLLDDQGSYCDIPSEQQCHKCLVNNKQGFASFYLEKDIKLWRSAWAVAYAAADEIVAFSVSTLNLFKKAYPLIDFSRAIVRPHKVEYIHSQVAVEPTRTLTIGILGKISFHKGAQVVSALAKEIKKRQLDIKIQVIGSIDADYDASIIRETGDYNQEDLPELIRKSGANIFLFPSIWPETFSYVVQELIEMGLPVACFDMGAPAERLAHYPKGLILSSLEPFSILAELQMFHRKMYPTPDARAQIHVFTSAAFNYIPKVRMLFQSLRRHHPEWKLHLVLADVLRPEIDLANEPFDTVLTLDMLEIPNWKQWAFGHTIVELATAIKPFALAHLFKQPGIDKVLYMDPDTVAFSRLDDIVESLEKANIVLTPHQSIPEATIESIANNEICSLKHGIFNLGFIGVANNVTGRAFAKWWANRLYYFCCASISNGLFTDQRWIDFVPVFFDGVQILRSSRHNVSTWNLTTRELSCDINGEYRVDGKPLGFYHFTGFDSGAHRIMAAHNAAGNLAVLKIVNWYDDQTKVLADDPIAKTPWAFATFADGQPISKAQRLIYRIRPDLQKAFPEPFDPSGYLNSWWNVCARNEYPNLFDSDTHDTELEKLSAQLIIANHGATPIFSDS